MEKLSAGKFHGVRLNRRVMKFLGKQYPDFRCSRKEAGDCLWPIASLSQFGPCPLLVEPDIAVCPLLLAVDHGPSGGPW
jgi:hypothetical protein